MPNIEELIRKAMAEGKFDDLPGKGKPLSLDDNPHADPEWNMAYHMLKSSGYTLPWIDKRQELLSLLEAQRQALKRAWEWRQTPFREADLKPATAYQSPALTFAQVEGEWRRALEAFRKQMGELDKRIRDFNLEVPSERFQLPRRQIEKEIDAIINPGATS